MANKKRQESLIDIVYPVYGQYPLLKESIDKLQFATNKNYNIYLVDDFSKDLETAGRSFYNELNKNPKVKSIQYHKKNEGFGKTVNDGAKLGFSKYILIINTDVILHQNSLDIMVDYLENNPKVGMVGPKLLFFPNTNDSLRPNGRIQHVFIGFDSMCRPYHQYSGWEDNHPKVNKNRSVNAITGACMLVRRDLWTKLKGFDPIYGKGCLLGDSLLITEDGLIEIESIMGNNRVDKKQILIQSIGENVKTAFTFRNGLSEVCKLTTKKGYSITATLNHKIYCMGDDGLPVWKEIKDLTQNDYIGINLNSDLWGSNHIDSEEAYLCGLFVAEGNVDKTRICITNGDRQITDILVENHNFKLNKNNKYHYRKNDYELYNRLKNIYGFDFKKKSPEKIIPNYIMQSDEETIKNFLSGLFDGDGSAKKNGRVTLTSTSYKLLKQVQLLLLNFGILSSLNDKYKNDVYRIINNRKCFCKKSYTLELTSFSHIFYEKIGFRLTRKQIRKEAIVKDYNFIDFPKQGIFMNRIMDNISGIYKELIKYKKTENPTRMLIEKFLQDDNILPYRNSEDYKNLYNIINGNVIWLNVNSLEFLEGKFETFDLNVPKTHAYTANGIIVHNTFEDLDICVRLKLLNNEIHYLHNAVGYHYTNASVLAANESYPLDQNGMIFRAKFEKIMPYDDYSLDMV